ARHGAAQRGAASGAVGAWWSWRGPLGTNIAASAAFAPTALSDDHLLWQTPVPGRGHSSPVVSNDSIYLTTADTDQGTQSVLAFDRENGRLLWSQVAHRGGLPTENHRKNSEASPTAAFDGT